MKLSNLSYRDQQAQSLSIAQADANIRALAEASNNILLQKNVSVLAAATDTEIRAAINALPAYEVDETKSVVFRVVLGGSAVRLYSLVDLGRGNYGMGGVQVAAENLLQLNQLTGQVGKNDLETTLKAATIGLSAFTDISTTKTYVNGAITKTATADAAATGYKRTGFGAGVNMFAVDSGKHYYYSGVIDNALYAGVIYFTAALAFIGYECGTVATYSDFALNPPANAAYFAVCGKTASYPLIKYKTDVYKTDTLRTDVDAVTSKVETNLFTMLFERNVPAGASGTGAFRAGTGSINGAYTAYLRSGASSGTAFPVTSGKYYYYSGVVESESDPVAGVVFFNAAGAVINTACETVQTYTNFLLAVPAGTAFIGACSKNTAPVLGEYSNVATATAFGSNVLYVDAAYAGSVESGTVGAPYKTISAAINVLAKFAGGEIIINPGDYRETLPLANIKRGTLRLTARQGGTPVRILGSTRLTGWVLSSGYANTYEIPFTGSVPTASRWGQQIFEDKRNSRPIDAGDVSPFQKGLTHRLPFTPIQATTSIANVEASPGTFFVTGGKMYLHTTDGGNPATNGYSYENITRAWNTYQAGQASEMKPHIIMSSLTFMFGSEGFRATGFESVTRYDCTALGSAGGGCWLDNTAKVLSYRDEAGYCDGDGFNGHWSDFGPFAVWGTQQPRSSGGFCIYYDLWTHDNFDDGFSHHERHDVTLYGGLSEYNGDAGYVASNDGNYALYNATSRYNGQRLNVIPSEGVAGEGFGQRGTTLTTKNNGKCVYFGCFSKNNVTGFNGAYKAQNCMSVDSAVMEYGGSAATTIRACYAKNATPSKYKSSTVVVENGVMVT